MFKNFYFKNELDKINIIWIILIKTCKITIEGIYCKNGGSPLEGRIKMSKTF